MPGLSINLARQGHVVFSYDMLAYNDSRQVQGPPPSPGPELQLVGHRLVWGFSSGTAFARWIFLQSLPDVDPGRIGCTGASGGGTQTFLLTAVDDRIKVSAPVNMISHYMQGGCICENQPNLRLDTNNMEIAALMAPRPLLMVSASGDWTRETPRVEFPAVQSIYRLLGAGHKVQTMQTMAEHNFNRKSREAVYAWFGRWLLGETDASQFSEKRFRLGSPSELLVFFGRELPDSAVTEEEMLASLKERYRQRIDELRPEDSEACPGSGNSCPRCCSTPWPPTLPRPANCWLFPFPLPSRVRGRISTSAGGGGGTGCRPFYGFQGEAQESDGHAAGSPGQGGAGGTGRILGSAASGPGTPGDVH